MPSIKILYDAEGWAYHQRARMLQRHAPPDFTVSIGRMRRSAEAPAIIRESPEDLIFCLALGPGPALREALQALGQKNKLVCGWNAGWPRQIEYFYTAYPLADALIINNRMAWERIGRLLRTYMLPNGVDLDTFKIRVPPEDRKPKVLWVGSEVGRIRKGYDRFLVPLQSKLRARGIDCELLLVDSHGPNKRTPTEMAEWYNTGTVLVCASNVEGTPNPALEAAACGCTVVSTAVGNMPELIRDGVNGYLVEREFGALLAGVSAACEHYLELSAAMQTDIQAWDWKVRSPEFFDVFREILSGGPLQPRRRQDLSTQVTVFVTTVGAPSFDACMQHLQQQDCTFQMKVIDHVAPMSAAFQRMLDECTTPFYVQVDEDMLLYSAAVRTLYEAIAAAKPNVAMMYADLYDAHLGMPLVGVKIFRHAIVQRYPLRNVQSFEKVQLEQLAADGYDIARVRRETVAPDGVLGLHGTHWTPPSIYERYATLQRRYLGHPHRMEWFQSYPQRLLERFLEEPSELNLYAIMGIISGTLAARSGETTDKDFRCYDTLPGLAAVRSFVEELARRQGRPPSSPKPVEAPAVVAPAKARGKRVPAARAVERRRAVGGDRQGGARGKVV